MPIIRTEIVSKRQCSKTQNSVRIKYVFDSGEESVDVGVFALGFDLNAWIAARIPQVEQAAADAEVDRILAGE